MLAPRKQWVAFVLSCVQTALFLRAEVMEKTSVQGTKILCTVNKHKSERQIHSVASSKGKLCYLIVAGNYLLCKYLVLL